MNFDPSGDQRETKKYMSTVLPKKNKKSVGAGRKRMSGVPLNVRHDIEGEDVKDVAQFSYAIGKATVCTKKSKQKARGDFIKGAKSAIK